jgi:hypothetical protein
VKKLLAVAAGAMVLVGLSPPALGQVPVNTNTNTNTNTNVNTNTVNVGGDRIFVNAGGPVFVVFRPFVPPVAPPVVQFVHPVPPSFVFTHPFPVPAQTQSQSQEQSQSQAQAGFDDQGQFQEQGQSQTQAQTQSTRGLRFFFV